MEGATVIKIFDEARLMKELNTQTVDLIHSTSVVDAMKKLLYAHDIITLNLEIQNKFGDKYEDPLWDVSALQDLSKIRRELMIYHISDFEPPLKLNKYSYKMGALLVNVGRRLNVELP